MKKVLIITYYWPPSGGAGVQRWLKFSKYLPEFDWEPIILTVDPKHASYAQLDESLLKEISPELKIYKTRSSEIYNTYKNLTLSKDIPYGGFANDNQPSILGKISRFIRGNFFIPDPRKGWNKYAFNEAKHLIEKYNIQHIITTSPPHSTQLIGLKLKKQLGVKWIADFRDPWTDIYYYNELYHTALARFIDMKLERKVINSADALITVSKDFKRIFERKKEKNTNSNMYVVPNGYDEDDFNIQYSEKSSKFIITYTGTITEKYDISGLISALKELITKRNHIILRFVGHESEYLNNHISNIAPDLLVEYTGYVSHLKSIEYLLSSNIQLLIVPKIKNNKGIVPGKFFEYLASQKPILAIGPKGGDLEELINETGSGVIVGYNDSETITQWLSEQLQKPKGKQEGFNCDKYSRRMLTEKLSEIIDAPT
jgi:glycosyltransferase involved in cell wall biosynthesis